MLQVVPTGHPCSTCGYETSYMMLKQGANEEATGYLCDCCSIEWSRATVNLTGEYEAAAREFVKRRFKWTAEERQRCTTSG